MKKALTVTVYTAVAILTAVRVFSRLKYSELTNIELDSNNINEFETSADYLLYVLDTQRKAYKVSKLARISKYQLYKGLKLMGEPFIKRMFMVHRQMYTEALKYVVTLRDAESFISRIDTLTKDECIKYMLGIKQFDIINFACIKHHREKDKTLSDTFNDIKEQVGIREYTTLK